MTPDACWPAVLHSRHPRLAGRGSAAAAAQAVQPLSHIVYRLVDHIPCAACRIADIVAQRGFGDSKQWLKNWEKVWQATLNTCRLDGNCTIRLV